MPSLYPLRFRPILRRHLWGGRRLETALGKSLPPGNDWGKAGRFRTMGPIRARSSSGRWPAPRWAACRSAGRCAAGRHHPQPSFPLLLKFIDACQTLSVQVHPDDARAARLDPPDGGKTEAWFVVDAAPGSKIYAGLKPGINRPRLLAAIEQGTCEECLNAFAASPGDCVFVPAGTVHAIGAGLLVAEIQQSSDTTYRLFDWNRLGPDGKLRTLHVAQGLDAIDFGRGPVMPQRRQATDRPQVTRLVACDKFVWDRWEFDAPMPIGGDDRCHILAVLQGAVGIEGDPAGAVLPRGQSALLPASLGPCNCAPKAGPFCWMRTCRSKSRFVARLNTMSPSPKRAEDQPPAAEHHGHQP